MNGRIIVLIIILVVDVASALGVVYARHQSRNLSTTLGALEADRDAAIAECGALATGDAARLTDAGSLDLTAGDDGAEVLVWATA